MKRKLLLPILPLLISCYSIHAQVTPACVGTPPGGESCNTTCVYCDFDGYTGSNNGSASGGNTVCGTIALHNDQWFGFVAGSSDITIDIITTNCANTDGMQAAFFDACDADDAITCNPGGEDQGSVPLTLSYNNFVPGQTYYLMVDGWSGDVCDFEIDVTAGSITPPPPGVLGLLSGPTSVCPGATVTFTIPDLDNAGYYNWTAPSGSLINGEPTPENFAAPEGTSVEITFGNTGGQVCVTAGNACFPPQTRCISVTNQPIPPTQLPDLIVCAEDTPFIWDESPNTALNLPGTYNLVSSPYNSYQDCDSTVRQKIIIKNQINYTIPGFQYICAGECFERNGNSYCSAGTYNELLESYQGCDSTVYFTVVELAPVANIANTLPAQLTCTSPVLTLDSEGSNPDPGPNTSYNWYTMSWAPVGNGITYNANVQGTYHLVVTNTAGAKVCKDTADIVITSNNTAPVIAPAGGTLGCAAGSQSVTLQANSSLPGMNYLWSGPGITPANQNQASPSVTAAGTYNVTVTNPTSMCTATGSAMVNANNTPPTASATAAMLTCTQPTINIDATTNAAAAMYNWSGPGINAGNQTVQDPPVTVPGTYNVTITNTGNGCSATATVNVSQDNAAPTVSAGADATLTCTQTSLSLNGSGSPANVNYNWTGPAITPATQNLPNPSVNLAGTYILTVTNPTNGCAKADTVSISSSINAPIADAGANPTLTCVVNSVVIGGNTSSQGANFQATWTGPGINATNQNQYTPTVTASGAYTLTVLNTQNGCSSTATVTVNLNNTAPTANAGADQLLTCTTTNGVALTGSGTPANVTYLWSGPGIGANNESQASPMVTVAGNYSLQVTDPANGCTATDAVMVDQDASVPTANAGADLVLTCSVTAVDFDASASSSGAGITYTWTGPGISGANTSAQNPAGITMPGTYNLTVTNSTNNCENTDVLIVSIDTIAPAASAGLALVLNCYNNGSDTLDASASDTGTGYTVLWSGPGITPANESQINPVVSAAGTYTVTITSTNNACVATSQTTVTDDQAPPTADAGTDQIIDCVTTSTAIGGSSSTGGTISYVWTGPDIDAGNATLATPTVALEGTYTLVVTNSTNGCTATDDAVVTLNATYPTTSAGADQTVTCAQPSVTLDGSASSTGANMQTIWSGPDINAGNQGQLSPAVTLPGTYILTITDQTNSCATVDTVVVSENKTLPAALAGADGELDCQTTSFTLDGSQSAAGATISYLWTGLGITPANETQQSPAVDQPGTYTLVVTDSSNGCTGTDAAEITQDIAAPTASAGNTFTLTCLQNTLAIDGSGSSTGANITYLWQGPGINTSNFDVQSPMVSDSGTYVLLVTNTDNFCADTAQVYVALDGDFPLAEAGTDQTLTCAAQTVQLDGTQSDAGAGITYSWSGPGIVPGEETNVSPNVTEPGLYTLTVNNTNNGCIKTDFVNVDEDLIAPTADAGADQILTCGTVNGVTISAAGSSNGPGYSLQWTGPGIDASNDTLVTPNVTLAGDYTLVVTSAANGCTATDNVTVGQDQNLPTANAGPDFVITCDEPQALLDGSGSTTGGTITFLWSGPGINTVNQGEISPNVSAEGTYTLQVTNTLTNCQASDNVVVTLDNLPPQVTLTSDTITCAEPEGTLAATSSAMGSSFLWEGVDINPGNQNDEQLSISEPGLYSVTVTAPNGCTSTSSIEMAVDANFPMGAAEGGELNCANGGETQIGGSIQTPGATFDWAGPNNFDSDSLQVVVSVPGTYTFTVISSNGCERDFMVEVTSDFQTPLASAVPPEFLDCNTSEVSIFGTGSSVGPNYNYAWTTTGGNILAGDNTLEPLVDAAGDYTLLVTNTDNGCTNTTTVSVQNDPEVPTAFDLSVQNIRCYGETTGVISVNGAVGGTAPFEFALYDATGAEVQGFNRLAEGEYTVSLLDANGCTLDTTVSISAPEELLVDLGDDIEIQLGESATVIAEIANDADVPVAGWVWTPAAQCDSTCLEYTGTPLSTYRQRILVTDENGCTATDEVVVVVRKDRLVFVPTIFNPEGDNPANALLSIYTGPGVTKIRKWLIFDRWGDAVFQVDEYQPVPSNVPEPAVSWDGRVRGEKAIPSVYVWYAEIEFADGAVEIFKGDVTLFRE